VKRMKTFGALEAAKRIYGRHDFRDEFPTTPDDPDGDLDEEIKELHDEALLETKSAGYVDTDPDPSPKPNAARLRRYWTRGEGAAKIQWGVDGDFRRCVKQLRKYVGPGAEGLCNVYHTSAIGKPPGKGPHVGKKHDVVADIETKQLFVEDTSLRLENLFLSKALFEGWERVEAKSGQAYDVGYNITNDMWEAHNADNFLEIVVQSKSETDAYTRLNEIEGN
jgi:hypothetical protein